MFLFAFYDALHVLAGVAVGPVSGRQVHPVSKEAGVNILSILPPPVYICPCFLLYSLIILDGQYMYPIKMVNSTQLNSLNSTQYVGDDTHIPNKILSQSSLHL